MAWLIVLAHILLPAAAAMAASFGAWRCWRLLRHANDPRLVNLMWFYGLFAASLVPWAVWVGRLAAGFGDVALLHSGAAGHVLHEGNGAERVDGFLVAHHLLMLASLAVAVWAYRPRTPAAAAAGVGFAVLGPFIPTALAVEAALTLYVAVRAVLNSAQRRTPGALQVAAGFLLFFLGHLAFFLFHHPGAARTPFGDLLALVGVVLLVQLLPRPSA